MGALKVNDIPEDLVMDILTRLSVKCLKRFSCVCKSWFNLFKDPNFIAKHHHNQISPKVLVHHHADQDFCFSILSYSDGYDGGNDETLTQTRSISIPFVNSFGPIPLPRVVGTCNGLICIDEDRDGETIILWNPATREFKPLPLSAIEHKPAAGTGSYFTDCLGFGFDQNTNDYKVLRFVTNRIYGNDPRYMDHIELYSLKSDSWREIPNVDLYHHHMSFLDPYINGVYYWWATDHSVHFLLSFDFTTETFENLPLPDFKVAWADYVRETQTIYGPSVRVDQRQVCIYNGLPAVIFYPVEGQEKLFDIWVMTEHGVKESWVKQMSIGPVLSAERPLGFCKTGGIFLEDFNEQMVLYDHNTQEYKNLPFHGFYNELQVVNYVESLVSIHGAVYERIDDDDDKPFMKNS